MNKEGKTTREVDGSQLVLIQGDITDQTTEAIVNAANKKLAPGGGVAGAIHSAAGPKLWEECRQLGGCETGEAKITKGYELPASYVIHTVGPVYSDSPEDAELLKSSYLNSLRLARDNGIQSVSFPSLSTGAFGYPIEEAAPIALRAIEHFLRGNEKPDIVRVVLYSQDDYEDYVKALQEL